MRLKRFLVTMLVLVNLVLMGSLVIISYDLPEAFAQQRGGSSKYAAVTAQYTGGTDALYVLHVQKNMLLVIIPEQNQSGRMHWPPRIRNVAADFGG